jgi:hypothetical protein
MSFLPAVDLVAQGDQQPQIATGTGVMADEDEAAIVPVTAVSPEVAPPPCKLQLGDRFEYRPSTTVEVDRRYVQIPFGSTSGGGQVLIDYTDQIKNLVVQPNGLFSTFYAGYSGGMNVRMYQDTGGRQRPLLFYPMADLGGALSSNTYMGHMLGIGTALTIPSSGGTSAKILCVQSSGLGAPTCREVSYPISNSSWIDVNVPYQTQLDFIPLPAASDAVPANKMGTSLGVLSVVSTTTVEDDYPDEAFYFALGDDASYGIYRPPTEIRWEPVSGGLSYPTDTSNIGGFYPTIP